MTKKTHILLSLKQLNIINNLMQNYKIILNELTKTCSHIESFGLMVKKYDKAISDSPL